MAIASFPFPTRNAVYPADEDIIFVQTLADKAPHDLNFKKRKLSKECRIFRAQYFSIEEELLRAFDYVSPSEVNATAFSPKLGSIIKEAANIFELLSKYLYSRFYNDTDKINIFNYLALDVYLNYSKVTLKPLSFLDGFSKFPEVTEPFHKLKTWSRASDLRPPTKGATPSSLPDYIPGWWDAYNALKHTNAGLDTYATLANAISATGAVYVSIHKIFGTGVVSGWLEHPDLADSGGTPFSTVQNSRVFFEVDL